LEGSRESLPAPPRARPNFTPASLRTLAGERDSGGPTSTSSFSHVSGAGRAPVRITGMEAFARSDATF